MNQSEFPLQIVVDYALATREDEAIRRDLAKGLNPYQEEYAYKHICPRAERRDEHRALRIIGLLSDSRVGYAQEITFGQWCNRLDAGESVEKRLLALQNLSFDQAVKEVKRLLMMGAKGSGGFNWYDLAGTLYFWGQNRSESARRVRLKLLSDYYRASSNQSQEGSAS